MIAKDFSRKELINILEAIDTARTCTSSTVLRQVLKKAKTLVCADYSICGLGRIHEGRLASVLMLVNGDYPEEWVDMYRSEGLYRNDPVIKYHTQFCGTQVWSNIFSHYKDKGSKNFLERAGDFGLKYGISSGIFDPDSKLISIFSFASESAMKVVGDRFNGHHKKITDVITLHLHKALVKTYETGKLNIAPSSN